MTNPIFTNRFKLVYFESSGSVFQADNQSPKHLYTEKVAKFTLGDFTEMLSYQGLQVLEVFGDYQLGKYQLQDSPRLILVARKLDIH